MIRVVDVRGRSLDKSGYQELLPRAELDISAAMATIEPILARVKTGDEKDLLSLCAEFDGIAPASIRVPQSALDQALSELDPRVRAALEKSAERIRLVHV